MRISISVIRDSDSLCKIQKRNLIILIILVLLFAILFFILIQNDHRQTFQKEDYIFDSNLLNTNHLNEFRDNYIFDKNQLILQAINNNNKLTCKKLYLSQAENEDIEKELTENIENQLDEIDFSQLDSIVNSFNNNQKQIFGGSSFLEVVKNFLYGNSTSQSTNFLSYMLKIILNDLINILPYFALIVAIAIIYSLVGHFSLDKGKSVASIVHIACFCAIALIVLNLVIGVMQDASRVIFSISSQMEVVFPVLLTLISSIGGAVTASTFQPVLATLTTVITKIFTNLLFPVFIFCIVFNIVGNISNNVKLEKFSKFCSSFFNWTIGIIFTIFIAFLTINGLTVSSIDGISIKTAKYAIKSHIPILGSYLSDGVSLIITSSNLIKNAVGVTGLVLLTSTILSPIFNLVLLMLLFKLVSAIIEPFCDQKISNFLYSVSKTLNMLNICLIAIGFMYLISVSILMLCSNLF